MKSLDDELEGHEVRLFSAVSIGSEREAEMRATAAFLSVLQAVSEFGRNITRIAGSPAGTIKCYTEVELKSEESTKKFRPDGVIVVSRGKKVWRAILEVKVGVNGIKQEQFDSYHILARSYGFDALLTVSNQAALPNGFPPVKVDMRRARGCSTVHFSWERLLSEAQLLSWQCGVSDRDQEFILKEWLRYINDTSSKIITAPSVGAYWNDLLSCAASDRLDTMKQDLEGFINTWCGFLRIQSFRLRALLGEQVEVRLRGAEKKDPGIMIKRLVSEAITDGKISSFLVIPHTAGDLKVTINLKARRVFFEVDVAPPEDKTTRGQIGWIVGQLTRLKTSPSGSLLIVTWKKRGLISECLVQGIGENRDRLLLDMEKNLIPGDIKIRLFSISWETRFARKKSELFPTIGADIERFYKSVVEHLTVYVPPAPKIIQPVEKASNVRVTESSTKNSRTTSEHRIMPLLPWLNEN